MSNSLSVKVTSDNETYTAKFEVLTSTEEIIEAFQRALDIWGFSVTLITEEK